VPHGPASAIMIRPSPSRRSTGTGPRTPKPLLGGFRPVMSCTMPNIETGRPSPSRSTSPIVWMCLTTPSRPMIRYSSSKCLPRLRASPTAETSGHGIRARGSSGRCRRRAGCCPDRRHTSGRPPRTRQAVGADIPLPAAEPGHLLRFPEALLASVEAVFFLQARGPAAVGRLLPGHRILRTIQKQEPGNRLRRHRNPARAGHRPGLPDG